MQNKASKSRRSACFSRDEKNSNQADAVGSLECTSDRNAINETDQLDQALFIPKEISIVCQVGANAQIWQTNEMAEVRIANNGKKDPNGYESVVE